MSLLDGALFLGCNIDEFCPAISDDTHCSCWWDGYPCCACLAPAMTDEEKRESGMDVEQDLPCSPVCTHEIEARGCEQHRGCSVAVERRAQELEWVVALAIVEKKIVGD